MINENLLELINNLIFELKNNNLRCDKIQIIKNLLKSNKDINDFEVKQKIMLDMRPIYDNGYDNDRINSLLEDIYKILNS